jgi:DNA-binding HxlR family transcriptional regulator
MVKCPNCTCPNTTNLFTILGKKWVIFILYAVDNGASTFTDIRRDIGDANTKILTDRLHELVELSILEKSDDGIYTLSPQGAILSKKLKKIASWWWEESR